jgi:hypothetical protein
VGISYPDIGQWFRRPNGTRFEVVAIDENGRTVEIQQFDGTIDELDVERWPDLLLREVGPPEDFSGSLDMDPEDADDRNNSESHTGYHNPLAFLDDL